MMDICGCVFPGRRQIAGVRECECGCKGVWLGSCLGQCWVNYKVAAVWGCTLSSPFSWPAGLLAGLIVVRLLGKEIDALCQGADNIVLDFTVLVKLTGGRGTGEVLFFFSPEAMWLIWLSMAMLTITQPGSERKRKLAPGQWDDWRLFSLALFGVTADQCSPIKRSPWRPL